jgi:2-polyprenyl-6-hydroxyphenyl methylase/3-demethylubiquinone-9 3-methyltransferase
VTGYHDRPWEALRPGPDHRPYCYEARREFLLGRARPGERALDLGCGVGDFTAALAEAGVQAIGVDASALAVRIARERHPGLDFRHVPAEDALPFPDAGFDLVWLGGVIGHVLDTEGFLDEVARVLRGGGRLVLSTEYHGRVKLAVMALGVFPRHFDPRGGHIRFYTRRSLRDVLAGHGFADVRIATVDGPPLLRSTMLACARRTGPG